MNGFFESFGPIIQKHKVESLLVVIALIIALLSVALYFENNEKTKLNIGLFQEKIRTLDHNSKKINVNTASLEQLDELPGIGKSTAQNIIQNRPYDTIEELVTKKAVKKNIYERIKDLIDIN